MLKNFLTLIIVFVLLAVPTSAAFADKPAGDGDVGRPTEFGDKGRPAIFGDKGKPADFGDRGKPNEIGSLENGIGPKTENGFDEWGYNRTARVFNGTGLSWCIEKLKLSEDGCRAYMGAYADDKLVMKWNAEWDRGNDEGWNTPPYDAWLNNQWNGMVPGGSGEVWHYKYVWVGPCTEGEPFPDGGYCIWGQFKVILSQGVANGEHSWETHAKPSGYGVYP